MGLLSAPRLNTTSARSLLCSPVSKLRAAGYVRVSTARQAAEGLSLPEQEGAIRDLAEREGWELVDLYIDAGVSRVARPTGPSLAAYSTRLPEGLDRSS